MTEPLTMQHYFEQTINYLRKQETRSMTPLRTQGSQCAYRGAGNNHCAVGYWIPDDYPLKAAGGVRDLSERHPDLAGIAWPDSDHGLDLAGRLQGLHDDDGNVGFRKLNYDNGDRGGLSDMGEAMARAIATRFNLDYTEPGL